VGEGSGMSAGMKWVLGVSLMVNVFLVAGGIAATAVVQHHMREMPKVPPGPAWEDVEKQLSPETRTRVREIVKAAALDTESDMTKAHDLRAQAEQLAQAPHYDAARIVDLAEQARSYENMSRAKIETAMIQDMASLPAKDRGPVAVFVLRPGFHLRKLLTPSQPGPADAAQPQSQPAAK
jgi:uncharacterized membrane protein